MRTPNTFTGSATMGSAYSSDLDCAAANLAEWATAGGLNTEAQALGWLTGRASALAEMAADGWACHEITVTDWAAVAEAARLVVVELSS